MKRRLIQVFARPAVPGYCKSRLARFVGGRRAAKAYAAMQQHTLTMAQQVCPTTTECWLAGAPRQMRLRPAARLPCFRQQGGDLGQRMAHAVASGLARAQAVVLVGTDCPGLSPHTFRAAFRALDGGAEVVIGPATDGGYYLLGVSGTLPDIFTAMRWGSATVFAETRQRLDRSMTRWLSLPALADVDRGADLHLLRRR